jgi:TonB family protein
MSGKAVREVGIGYVKNGRADVVAGYVASMNPGESRTIRSEWRRRNVLLPGTTADVSLRVLWVTFADNTRWGVRAGVPAPPAPPLPSPPAPPLPPGEDEPGNVEVSVSAGGGGSGRSTSGGGVSVGGSDSQAGEGRGSGVGVGVGAGTGRGSGRGGGLVSQRVYTPEPAYPAIARAAGAQGSVGVRITVNEEGEVVAAEAVSGHPLLRPAAVEAARASKFKPAFVEGRPVKTSGVVSYSFTLK